MWRETRGCGGVGVCVSVCMCRWLLCMCVCVRRWLPGCVSVCAGGCPAQEPKCVWESEEGRTTVNTAPSECAVAPEKKPRVATWKGRIGVVGF